MKYSKLGLDSCVPMYSSEFFSKTLNHLYDNLCSIIKTHEGDINIALMIILSFIAAYWEFANEFSKEDLYMVLNALKLARSLDWKEFSFLYDSENFQKLDENYNKLVKLK
jgi:hypothetical protein